jgi:hypothetical protein
VGSPEKEIATPDFTARHHPASKANGLSTEQVSQHDEIKLKCKFFGAGFIDAFN